MPELPEVEVITRFLSDKVINQQIRDIKLNRKVLRVPITENIAELIKHQQIIKVFRRAKYIVFTLNNNHNIIIHLGMSGKLLYHDDCYIENKHDHVIFFLKNNNIIFNDCRRFGLIIVLNNIQLIDFFNTLAIEPLSNEFNAQYLYKLFANSKINIKSCLMNNKFVVGIGNIYASEILFEAKISPLRIVKSLTLIECQKLVISAKKILTKAIYYGGSTLKDYKIPSGFAGNFQCHFSVYGKDKQSCIFCNNTIIKIQQNSRSTFYCKNCQS